MARIRVEVVYALPHVQQRVELELPAGAIVSDALAMSRLAETFPEIARAQAGRFGETVSRDAPLADGDRIELYRPLAADPRDARRKRARRR